MAKLHRAFNASLVKFLRFIYRALHDSVPLYDELVRVVQIAKVDPEGAELFEVFDVDIRATVTVASDEEDQEDITVTVEDLVFDSNPEALLHITFFRNAALYENYGRLVDEEVARFWHDIQGLCKFRAMLSACGNQSSQMESIAMAFVKNNPGLKPEAYHQKVFEEMLTGGPMRDRLIDTFKKPGAIQEILKNFGSVMRAPGQKAVDLSALADLTTSEDLEHLDEEFDEFQKAFEESGINPFEHFATAMGASDPAGPAEISTGAAQSVTDAMMKLMDTMNRGDDDDMDEDTKRRNEEAARIMEQMGFASLVSKPASDVTDKDAQP